MVLFKVASQFNLLALVRWRAQVHLCVTTGMMRVLNLKDPESAWGCGQWLWVCQVTRRRTPDGMSVTISLSGAAANTTSPCAASRPSPFSWTHVPSILVMAWLEPVEHLAPGAPNPRHPAAQVPWNRLRYHKIRDIVWLWYRVILISKAYIIRNNRYDIA